MKPRGALKEVKVRQALAYTIPSEDAIKGIRGGLGERAYGPFPKGVTGSTEEGLTKYQYDPNKAKQLLDEAGYKLTSVTPFDLFPHTPHVEFAATFDRVDTAPAPTP